MKTALVLLALALAAGSPRASADDAAGSDADVRPAAHARAPAVAVSVTRVSDGLEIVASSRLKAMPAAAWSVLTDYEGIAGFVSSMKESRVTERGNDYVLVEQSAVGRLFFFRRRMKTVLRVREQPPGRIAFEDVLRDDFRTYRGTWQIEDFGNEVEIRYRLTVRPAFRVPDSMARGSFQRAVRELMGQVGDEIERRAEVAGVRGLEGSGS